MPFYDFHCPACETTFTIRATIKEKETGLQPECPQCHSQAVEQVITAGLLLRGSSQTSDPGCCGPNAGPGCCG